VSESILQKLVNSHALFRLVIAVPAIVMLSRYTFAGGGLGQLLQSSGEWAARLLIVTLAITPIRMIFKGHHWPMWLFKRRRDLGVAAFLYAALHLGTYVARQSNLSIILYELPYIEYLLGWIAFAGLLILAAISNDAALHRLGTAWKTLQRLVYVVAIAAFLHWLLIKLDDTPAYIHFVPLALLEAWRLWYNFSRPSRRHLQE
jgi:methionine sulfoxide reductase heme-binding subunit